jgi:DNA-binding beta-propeller fold protein YncE
MLRLISSVGSALGLAVALAACGGGGGKSQSAATAPPPVAISGTVSGLAGTGLKLRFTASSSVDLVINANGAFTGPLFPRGSPYTVRVLDQPTQPWQTCAVTNGTGTLTGPINNVAVNCTTNHYHLFFNVTGLTGANFAVRLNGGAAFRIVEDGAHSFSADLASGTDYNLTIDTLPDGQDCTIANATGQVAGADITHVGITCDNEAFSSIVRNLYALDLAYNPVSGELYVSTESAATGPAIAVIDPSTGDTLRTVPTTHRAAPLAVSEDGQFLYAGLGATGNIRRYALPALTSDQEFSIGTDHTGQPLEAHDIRVAPGDARTVAVTRLYKQTHPWGHGLAIFDDGVMRPDTIGDSMPMTGVQADGALWSADGTRLYSLSMITTTPRYYHSAVSATGVTLQHETPLPEERSYGFGVPDLRHANRNYQMAGDRLYSATGAVFDPARRTQIGAFRTQGQGLAIDTARNKAFFASGGFLLPVTFESFDLARMTPIAVHTVQIPPNANGQVQKLLRWGTDGLAAITTSQLIIVRGTFVSDPTGGVVVPPALVESTGTTGGYQYRIYDLPAHDVLWDSARERLYAAVGGQHRAFGNSIAAIDVMTNRVVAGAGTGSEPTRMSASDDGTRLYVTHYASSSVARIDLTTLRLDTVFQLNYPGQGLGYALAAEPQPGDASTFAYIEHYPAVSTVFTRMISNLTLRPQSFDQPISTLAFVDADTLFGNDTWSSALELHEIGVIPTGLQLVRSDPNIFNGQPRMTSAGGLLYGDGGFSIDPVTRTIVRTYNPGMGGASKAFRAIPVRDRGYMGFEDSGGLAYLMVFRLSDSTLLSTVPLPASLESPISLASMGANGVVITTTAGKTIIVQGPDL